MSRPTSAPEADLRRFLAVTLQVGLCVLVIRAFRIESPAFHDTVAALTLAGFVVHHWLPRALRLPAFVALCLAGIALVFGPAGGAWLIGLGLALLGIAHLPLAMRWRVLLMLAASGGLALLRAGIGGPAPWPVAIWAILGSMFMFRMALYLYDLAHGRGPAGPAQALAYFFMLPNVAFPLFPAVDFATFQRTYYDRDRYEIYQRGVEWMVRGLVHLLLYRLVYQHAMLPPDEVASALDLARYVLANFGLYLRVSGQFHLIVGMLHLFGFRLPETHHRFWLAPGFTEFWRRINIYWKDFMTKLVFNPSFFWLRERPALARGRAPMLLATLIVFVATWALHAYQWFWLLGSALLSLPDVLFWTALGALMLASVAREAARGRRRPAAGAAPRPRDELALALRTAAVFTAIALLWSLWTSDGLGEWLALLGRVEWASRDTALALLLLAGVWAALGGSAVYWARRERREGIGGPPLHFGRSVAASVAVLLALAAAGSPGAAARAGLAGLAGARVVEGLRSPELNRRDAAQLQRGYYEQLAGANRSGGELLSVYAQRPASWVELTRTPAVRQADGILGYELAPGTRTVFHDAPLTVNRWGMRDRDYEPTPPEGAWRIALLGSSFVMGEAVADEETFEAVTEQALGAVRAAAAGGPRVELLNFAVSDYGLSHQLHLLETKVDDFRPDVVLLVGHPSDAGGLLRHLTILVERGVPVPWPPLAAIVESAGARPGLARADIMKRLQPRADELVSAALRLLADRAVEHGAKPVWVNIPIPDRRRPADERERRARQARTAGWQAFDLGDVYDGRSLEALQVRPWDKHPNAAGHALIAERLTRLLRENPELLGASPIRTAEIDGR